MTVTWTGSAPEDAAIQDKVIRRQAQNRGLLQQAAEQGRAHRRRPGRRSGDQPGHGQK